jgi:hypothetical protein
MVLIYAWLQNGCCAMLTMFVYMLAYGPEKLPNNVRKGIIMAGACLAIALVPTFLATPNTINEVCSYSDTSDFHLQMNLVWSCLKLLIVVVLVVPGLLKRSRPMELDEADASWLEENAVRDGGDTSAGKSWVTMVPKGVLLTMTIMYTVKTMAQVVNTFHVLYDPTDTGGGFLATLVLETLLDHGQFMIGFAALLFDSNFTAHVGARLRSWTTLCRAVQASHLHVT